MVKVLVRDRVEELVHPEADKFVVDAKNPMFLHVGSMKPILMAVGNDPSTAREEFDVQASYIVTNVIRIAREGA